jgi:hypothetical protein
MHLPLASRPWDLLKSHLKTNFNTNRLPFAVFEQFTFNKSDGRPFGRPPLPTSRSHYPARDGRRGTDCTDLGTHRVACGLR